MAPEVSLPFPPAGEVSVLEAAPDPVPAPSAEEVPPAAGVCADPAGAVSEVLDWLPSVD